MMFVSSNLSILNLIGSRIRRHSGQAKPTEPVKIRFTITSQIVDNLLQLPPSSIACLIILILFQATVAVKDSDPRQTRRYLHTMPDPPVQVQVQHKRSGPQ
jgi:hypothetical protein